MAIAKRVYYACGRKTACTRSSIQSLRYIVRNSFARRALHVLHPPLRIESQIVHCQQDISMTRTFEQKVLAVPTPGCARPDAQTQAHGPGPTVKQRPQFRLALRTSSQQLHADDEAFLQHIRTAVTWPPLAPPWRPPT